MDILSSHLELATFCLGYMSSSPLSLAASKDEVEKQVQNGYYAFHDYASAHCFDHLLHVSQMGVTTDDEQLSHLSSICRSFSEIYGLSHIFNPSDTESHAQQIKRFIDSIPTKPRERDSFYDIGLRTHCVRNAIERLYEGPASQDKPHHKLCEMYGLQVFKCDRVDCRHFVEGFVAKALRDQHLDRHLRPYRCAQSGCPFQNLGFEDQRTLEDHIREKHTTDENELPRFPQARSRQSDDIHKAAARGDTESVKFFLDQGADANRPSRNKGWLTPLILAARNDHGEVCTLLLQRGADVNSQGPESYLRDTAILAAVRNNAIRAIKHLMRAQDIEIVRVGQNYESPLGVASSKGFIGAAKLLLDSGTVDLCPAETSHRSPLDTLTWHDELRD